MKYVDAVNQVKSKTYEFGGFRLEAENLSLFRNGEVIALPPKACEVLLFLVESGNRIVRREEILETVWADAFVEEANLTHHISALRKVLGEDSNGKKFIETIPRRGYRFIAEVEEIKHYPSEIFIREQTGTQIVDEIKMDELPQPIANAGRLESVSPLFIAKKSTKSWQKAVLAGAIAIIVFGVTSFVFFKETNSLPMAFEARKTTRLTTTGKVNLTSIAPDGKLIAYAQEENGNRQSLWIRHIASQSAVQIAPSAQVEYRALNISPDGSWLYYIVGQGSLYKMPVLGGAAQKIADNLFTSTSIDGDIGISPDGKQIAFVRRFEKEASALFLINADGTTERQLAAFEQPVRLGESVAWSPDGKVIACRVIINGAQNALAVQVADGTSAPVLLSRREHLSHISWMPDSKSLLMTELDGRIYQISYLGGETRQLSVEASFRGGISLTSDARFLVGVKTELAAHISIMPSDNVSLSKQLTAGFEKKDGVWGIDWTPDGKIVFNSDLNGEFTIWTVDPETGNSKQISKNGYYQTISPDGRLIVYRKDLSAASDNGLWQIDTSDGREKQLTNGTDVWPTFSPDNKWLVFSRFAERVGLWKMPSAGGEATLILDKNVLNPAVSPDGKTIAFILRRTGNSNRIALVSFDGGEIIKIFDANLERNNISNKQNLQWTRDGSGVYYVALKDGVSNIWRQPVDGSIPVQVTDFKDGRIFNFAFSPDGSQLALSRGEVNSDVLLIENEK